MKHLLLITFLLASLLSYSQYKFQYAGMTSKKEEIFIKFEKIETDKIFVWVKIVEQPTTFKNKKGKKVTKNGGYTLTLMAMDCKNRNYDKSTYIKYDSKGDIVYSEDLNEWDKVIVPDSVGELIFEFTCSSNSE
ncbi:MAG TPA: surface-adhesin E family protein [Flavobacterium sp.]|nr:surface-adhesin E family protein [Flavobacterium sp.]